MLKFEAFKAMAKCEVVAAKAMIFGRGTWKPHASFNIILVKPLLGWVNPLIVWHIENSQIGVWNCDRSPCMADVLIGAGDGSSLRDYSLDVKCFFSRWYLSMPSTLGTDHYFSEWWFWPVWLWIFIRQLTPFGASRVSTQPDSNIQRRLLFKFDDVFFISIFNKSSQAKNWI